MDSTCRECLFFTLHREGEPGGMCRRYPPVPIVLPMVNALSGQAQITIQSAFPESLASQFCGEFNEKGEDLYSSRFTV